MAFELSCALLGLFDFLLSGNSSFVSFICFVDGFLFDFLCSLSHMFHVFFQSRVVCVIVVFVTLNCGDLLLIFVMQIA